MCGPMYRGALIIAAALACAASSPAYADATNFILVNGTDGGIADVVIRRAGTNDWRSLGAAPSSGARSPVQFSDPDCAFDIRANVAGAPVTWTGVNLCDVKSVTLKRDGSAGPWVDYDE